jgi:hypothetical protein
MPEGKDFVDERAVWFVAGAAVEVEGSFDCLLAGLSRPRPKKRRRIVANVPCVGHVLRDGDIWTLTLKTGFGPNERRLGKAAATLISQGQGSWGPQAFSRTL